MASQDIEYSEKYFDDDFEYRCAPFFHFPRPDDARTCRLRPTAITLDV